MLQSPQSTLSCPAPTTMPPGISIDSIFTRQGYNASYMSSRLHSCTSYENSRAHLGRHALIEYLKGSSSSNNNSPIDAERPGVNTQHGVSSISMNDTSDVKPTCMHSNRTASDDELMYAVPPNYSDTNIFLRNLPSRIDDNALRCMAEPFGLVVSAAVMRDIYTGASLGTAFVRFSCHKDARAAMRYFANYTGGKRALVAQWAKKQHDDAIVGEARYKRKKLFIRNVPADVTEAAMEQIMRPYGTIENITLHTDTVPAPGIHSKPPYHSRYPTHSSFLVPTTQASLAVASTLTEGKERRLIAFVTFVETGAAAAACDAVHNTFPFSSCQDIPLMTKLAESSNQRKAAQHQSSNNYRTCQRVVSDSNSKNDDSSSNVYKSRDSSTNTRHAHPLTPDSKKNMATARAVHADASGHAMPHTAANLSATTPDLRAVRQNSMSAPGSDVPTSAMMGCGNDCKADHASYNLAHRVHDPAKHFCEQELLSESFSLSSFANTSNDTTTLEDILSLGKHSSTAQVLSPQQLISADTEDKQNNVVIAASKVNLESQSAQRTLPNKMHLPLRHSAQLTADSVKQYFNLHSLSGKTSPRISSSVPSCTRVESVMTDSVARTPSEVQSVEAGYEGRNNDAPLKQVESSCCTATPSSSVLTRSIIETLGRQSTDLSQHSLSDISAVRVQPVHKVCVKIRRGKYYSHNPYDAINTRIYYL